MTVDQKAAGRASADPSYRKTITVTTARRPDAVVLEVADNGTGLSEEESRRVFEPVYTTKEATRATGLGLSVTHAIVEDHGGTISGDGVQGEGAILRVSLPIAPE